MTERSSPATATDPQYIVEGIILRRLHERRIEGYTIETAKEIVASLQPATPTASGGKLGFKSDVDLSEATKSVASLYRSPDGAARAEDPAQVPFYPEAVNAMEALERRGYSMSEPHLSGYRLIIGFESLSDVQEAQQAIANLPPTLTARAAALTRSAAQGWRDIENAPQDGTRILLFQAGRGAFEGWWHDGWPSLESYWMDDQDSEPAPTHWQPTLAIPSTEGK
jgi:hypothetical protein